MTEETPRRLPKQVRSQERYDRILDTSANLFKENGFDRTTTNEIAREAGVSIGSLYQYFDNKEAIAEALAERYVTGLRAVAVNVMSAEVIGLHTGDAVDRLVDPILAFHASNPAFSPLWLGSDVSKKLDRSTRAMDEEILQRVKMLIRSHIPNMPEDRAVVVSTVLQGAVKSLLAFRGRVDDPSRRARVANEVKHMLAVYVKAVAVEYADRSENGDS